MSDERGDEEVKSEPPSPKMYELDWEELPKAVLGFDGVSLTLFRTRVPGGWLVYGIEESEASDNRHKMPGGLTFIPDSSHGWDGNSVL